MKAAVLFMVMLASVSGYADTAVSEAVTVNSLIPQAVSISFSHTFAFFRQEELGNPRAEMVDVLCSGGEIRIRITAQGGIREFRSSGDFYCYSATAVATAAKEKASSHVVLESVVTKSGDKNIMSSVVFKFDDGTAIDLYKASNGSLGQDDPLTETK